MPDFASDPAWLPHAYDPGGDRVQFLRFPQEVIVGPVFLAEYRPANAQDEAWLPVAAVKAMAVKVIVFQWP